MLLGITAFTFVTLTLKDVSAAPKNDAPTLVPSEKVANLKNTTAAEIAANKALEEINTARNDAIGEINSILKKYNSPMLGYESIIYDQAVACGGDYKILVAIAGNESGFGRVPYRQYNPYGYLDGVTYSGWNQSLTKLSCVISQRFIAPCHGDLSCIVNAYGGSNTNKARWINNIQYFINLFH